MKKLYILVFVLLSTLYSSGQLRQYNGLSGANQNWSTLNNWGKLVSVGTTSSAVSNKLIDDTAIFNGTVISAIAAGDRVDNLTNSTSAFVNSVDSATELTLDSDIMNSGDTYDIYGAASSFATTQINSMTTITDPHLLNVDGDYSQSMIRITDSRAKDLEIDGTGTLSIDVSSVSAAVGFLNNALGTAVDIKIDCNLNITNSLGGFTKFDITGNANNSITFGGELALVGSGNTLFEMDENSSGTMNQTYFLNGLISGSKNFLIGSYSKLIFSPTIDNTLTGAMNFYGANADVTVNAADGVKFFSGPKFQASQDGELTLNTKNTIATTFQLNNASVFTLNINKDQESLKYIQFNSNASGKYIFNIDTVVENINFWNCSSKDWYTATIEINGFKPGVIKFGDNASGLTATQLGKISIIGGDNAGKSVVLDTNGFLILAETLANTRTEKLDVSIYPNPVLDILYIENSDVLKSIRVSNLLGSEVLRSVTNLNRTDITGLHSGVYTLLLEYLDGSVHNRKIIIK